MDPVDYDKYQPNLDQDIPMAYAVFKPLLDETGERVVDAQYVFVNQKYCALVNKTKDELMGSTFCHSFEEINPQWFDFCYESAFRGKTIRSRIYSPETNHWIAFEVSPVSTPGLCAYTFMDVDEETAQRVNLLRENKTDSVIIRLISVLLNPMQYAEAIQNVLGELSEEIHPDRIYILETDGKTVSNTFEWCKEGVESEMANLQQLSCEQYMQTWSRCLKGNTSVVIEDIEEIQESDPAAYDLLKKQDIRSLLNSPIYDNGKIIGFVGVDNYEENDGINLQRLLETVAFFLSAKMVKERLLNRLDFLSHYDVLTGVHNRNAMMETIDRLEQTNQSVGILYVDDNGLKKLNDTYGHFYGDMRIKKTGQILCECFGKKHVYRAGGDEFVVLMPGVSKEHFLNLLANYQGILARDTETSVAIGNEWIPQAKDLRKAVHRADQQMYQDKQLYYQKCHIAR